MKKQLFKILCGLMLAAPGFAQENVYPAKEYKGLLFLKNATVHVGNGEVLEGMTIKVSNGKIEQIAKDLAIPMDDVKVFDVKGKHVYPGLILSNSLLGLVEVNSVRATVDHTEIGEINPSIRSIVAYNTDSKVINTLKSNGILLANIIPQGGLVSGSSTVVQLDAWNWEDAAYKMDNAIQFRMPSLINRPNPFAEFLGIAQPAGDPVKRGLEQVEKVKAFFREAQAYAKEPVHAAVNLKYEAVKGLFNKTQKLFVHCDIVKEMLVAVDFAKEFGMDVVIVGGSESFQIADLLKANNIPVILSQMHSLPTMTDDDVDQPYKTAAALQKAGVLFAINDEDGQTRGRNLPFNAGTAVAYGLTKEQALQAITLNAAKILGIADRTGSIEVGKDANLVVSEGDILDMRTSIITHAFIQGRVLDLTDKHKQLNERYKQKYNIK
ncbi:amidohydrolase family protein [Flavihumibacter rivuli]|uniref:amidohydrolase family protein n=1 Tax=Flavihumibacter rivuli TaxID=2838156 RepID=UPI001BDEB0C7|nr:amidohydrolase family protein [Flavihumibacter rivuli]ULQ56627.1 amidohydrolase family protein [Flavihumibacter rivuli]